MATPNQANTPTKDELVQYARQVAQKYGIDPGIFVAQIEQESGFNPNAKNKNSGASGIGQLMPQYYPNVDPFDPYQALDAAAQTDAQNLKTFGGRYDLMLAAYDAGAGAVQKAGGVPDIPETQTYVRNILGSAEKTPPAAQDGTYMAPMQDQTQPTDTSGTQPDPASTLGQILQTVNEYLPANIGARVGAQIAQAIYDRLTGGDTKQAAAPSSDDVQSIVNQIINANGQTTDTTPQVYSQEKLDALTKEHGGLTNTPRALNPTIKDPLTDLPEPNPTPTLRYIFNDGTTIDVTKVQDSAGGLVGYQVVSPGTALKGSTERTPTNQLDPITDPNTGKVIGYRDPQTGEHIMLPSTSATKQFGPVERTNDGSLIQQDPTTGQWKVIAGPGTAAKAGQVQRTDSGALIQQDPATGQWTQIAGPDPLTQEKNSLAIAQAQRNLQPQQQQLINDAYTTIDTIKQRMASGLITPDQATKMMQNVFDSVNAGLQGTTLFQQKQEAEREKEARATIGSQILQQRISSGSSLASSLLNAAASHVRMPAGQTTLGIDPMAIANNEVTTLGGGQNIVDLAKAMLQGAAVNGQTAQTPGGFPTTREGVLALYPELGGAPATAPAAVAARQVTPLAPASAAPGTGPVVARPVTPPVTLPPDIPAPGMPGPVVRPAQPILPNWAQPLPEGG